MGSKQEIIYELFFSVAFLKLFKLLVSDSKFEIKSHKLINPNKFFKFLSA